MQSRPSTQTKFSDQQELRQDQDQTQHALIHDSGLCDIAQSRQPFDRLMIVQAIEQTYERHGSGVARLLPQLLLHSKSGIQVIAVVL